MWFLCEIKVMKGLFCFDNIVEFLDYGMMVDGILFIVMEFIKGFILGKLLGFGCWLSE